MSCLSANLGRRALLKALHFPTQPKRYGYIVLIPEIGEQTSESDISLLNSDGLPEFNAFTIEKCINAVCTQTVAFQDAVKSVSDPEKPITNIFTDIFAPLEQVESPLELTWGVAKTLYLGNSSMMPTKSYVQVHEKALRARTSKFNNKSIYEAVLETQKKTDLTEEEKRLLQKYEIETRLNGINVPDNKREAYDSLLHVLGSHLKTFREKNAVSLKQFSHTVSNPEVVKDFPVGLLKNMSSDPDDPNRGPWKVTHQPSVYESFMEHCPNKTLRWNAWQAYVRLSSVQNDRSLETSTTLEKIRDNRKTLANMLGFETFAHMSMETKMAGSLENVNNMIESLLERARPSQDAELEKLQDFANENGFREKIEHCDVAYWKREQKKALYMYDEEELRDYFPLPVVLNSLTNLCSKLYEINIVERPNVNVWHKDVKFYDIFNNGSSAPMAGFYFDPYARKDEKISVQSESGWVIPIRNRSTITNTLPLAALIFNYQVPMYGKPSMLSFNEVHTLFYKFGYVLRHLLTESNYSDLAGLSNIEWDAAYVAGHVMTHWLYQPETLRSFSKHYATQEPLPDNVIDKIVDVRKHMAGYDLCQELYLSTLDLQLYSTNTFWRDIVNKIWNKYHAIPYDKYDTHPCRFTKVVSDQWPASYYCDLWSRMLAADIYSAFYEVRNEEEKVLEVARRYRDTFLSSGGSCHPSEVFRRFRGRDPSVKALLQILGLRKSIEK